MRSWSNSNVVATGALVVATADVVDDADLFNINRVRKWDGYIIYTMIFEWESSMLAVPFERRHHDALFTSFFFLIPPHQIIMKINSNIHVMRVTHLEKRCIEYLKKESMA